MRSNNNNINNSDSEYDSNISDNPEVHSDDDNDNDNDNTNGMNEGNTRGVTSFSGTGKIPFRSIRRDTLIDFRDGDDGEWYAVRVIKIDVREQRFLVSFDNSNAMEKWVVFDSNQIAKVHTHTYDGRGGFRVGQQIEFCDGYMSDWKRGVITALSAAQNRVEVLPNHMFEHRWISNPRNSIRPVQRNNNSVFLRSRRRWKVPDIDDCRVTIAREEGVEGGGRPEEEYFQGPTGTGGRDFSDQVIIVDETAATTAATTTQRSNHVRQITEHSNHYTQYVRALRSNQLSLVRVNGDGNCLFRSVAHQVYGDEELHTVVRHWCLNYMEVEADFFSQFVEGGREAFGHYLRVKRINGCWGDDPEIQALCEIYNRPAEIWAFDRVLGAKKLRTFHEAVTTTTTTNTAVVAANRPSIKLSYYGGGHYDSIIDHNFKASILSSSSQQQQPGEVEAAAISRRQHHRQRSTLTTSTAATATTTATAASDEMDAKKSSDVLATEREALEQAIQISRHEHLGWASEDIDAFLSLALDFRPTTTATATTTTTALPSLITGTATSTADAALLLARKEEGKEMLLLHGEALMDTASDLAAVQQDLMETVAQQSEREYLDAVILSSLKEGGEEESKRTDDDILEQARVASLQDFDHHQQQFKQQLKDNQTQSQSQSLLQPSSSPTLLSLDHLTDEQLLQFALQESMKSKPLLTTTTASTSSTNFKVTSSSTMKDTSKMNTAVVMDEEEEDAMLQEAIKESLRGGGGGGGGGKASSSSSSSLLTTNLQMVLDEEEELNRAIANSLKELQ